MSEHTISIPDVLYEKAKRLAQETSKSVDDVICHRLEGALDQPVIDLPDDERAELQALSHLSEDTLWTIAREQMQPELQDTMSQLMDKNSSGTITDDEANNLSNLVERGERLTLRKAQAMKLLLARGHAIGLDELNPAHE